MLQAEPKLLQLEAALKVRRFVLDTEEQDRAEGLDDARLMFLFFHAGRVSSHTASRLSHTTRNVSGIVGANASGTKRPHTACFAWSGAGG